VGGAGVPKGSAIGPGLLFFLILLVVFSLRAWLRDPADFYFINANRLASIALGSLFFASIIATLARSADAPRSRKIELIVRQAVAAAVVIPIVRTAIDVGGNSMEVGLSLAQTSRWLTVWIGYYLAGCAAFLLLWQEPEPARGSAGRSSAKSPDPQQSSSPAGESACLWIERGRQRVRVPLAEIDMIQADGDYLRVHSGDAEGLIRMTMVNAERRLAPLGFVRVHRSILCKRGAITAVFRSSTGAMKARLRDGREIPVGRNYRPVIADLIQKV